MNCGLGILTSTFVFRSGCIYTAATKHKGTSKDIVNPSKKQKNNRQCCPHVDALTFCSNRLVNLRSLAFLRIWVPFKLKLSE